MLDAEATNEKKTKPRSDQRDRSIRKISSFPVRRRTQIPHTTDYVSTKQVGENPPGSCLDPPRYRCCLACGGRRRQAAASGGQECFVDLHPSISQQHVMSSKSSLLTPLASHAFLARSCTAKRAMSLSDTWIARKCWTKSRMFIQNTPSLPALYPTASFTFSCVFHNSLVSLQSPFHSESETVCSTVLDYC